MRDQRPVHEGVACADAVARVDAQVLAVRDQVLDDLAALGLDEDRPLAAALLAELDDAVDLAHDRGVAPPPRLVDLRHAREAADDVLRALDLARGLREQRARLHLRADLDL